MPDLPSLLEALNYEDTFSHARYIALKSVKNVIEYYERKIWKPDENEMEEYQDVRKEVWDLVKTCCIQERRLLVAASLVLNSEILRFDSENQ